MHFFRIHEQHNVAKDRINNLTAIICIEKMHWKLGQENYGVILHIRKVSLNAVKKKSSFLNILWVHINATKVIPKKLLVKSSENGFILVPAFYLIMCLMKAPKNFENIAILKIWELVSFGGGKTHFGKLALKWCIFWHEKKIFYLILCRSFWSN